MRKYYTRPCNFYYGNYAKKLIKNKKASSLAGNPSIAFDKVEIFQRKKKHRVSSNYYSINEINTLNKEFPSDDLQLTRVKLSHIVSRDVQNLDKDEILHPKKSNLSKNKISSKREYKLTLSKALDDSAME